VSKDYSHVCIALILFVSFAAYYHFLSVNLPSGAGPDEGEHRSSIDFIYEHERLATYPEDIDKISFSPYGTTRTFSQPFAYVFAAVVSKLYIATKYGTGLSKWPDNRDDGLLYAHRQGGVVLASLSVVLLFLTIYTLTKQSGGSLLASVAFGLLPQLAFLASYSNNDIAAIFALFLMCLSVINLAGNRNYSAYILVGISCGLVVLSKPTIWSSALVIALFAVVSLKRWIYIKTLFIVSLPVALLVSGWWFAFNIYHHGIENVVNSHVNAQISVDYKTLPDGFIRSFSDIGYTIGDMLGNERNFLTVSYKSTVGYLDYFKLPLGMLQYWSYGLVLAAGGLFIIGSMIRRSRVRDLELWRTLALFILIALVTQFCVYVGWNYAVEIQPQGRYLLPTVGFIFVGFGILVSLIFNTIRHRKWINLCVAAGIVVFSYVHFDAIVRYVVPFYKPGLLYENLHGMVRVPIVSDNAFYKNNDVEILRTDDNTIILNVKGMDPWVALRLKDWGFENDANYIEIESSALKYDWMKLYWDFGGGFYESQSSVHALSAKRGKLGLGFPKNAKRLRLDMGEKSDNSYQLYAVTLGKARLKYLFDIYKE